MGLRGPGAKSAKTTARKRRKKESWQDQSLSRAEAVIYFIESLKITSGALAGQPFTLRPWQRDIVHSWYGTDAENRRVVRTGLLSVGRKNGKTGLCAGLALAHLLGPEQEQRGQIVVGATDRDQSALIFEELCAFIGENPQFDSECNVKRHEKTIEHKPSGSKFRALSSDAKKAHGLSPSVVILDELAQWGVGVGRALYDALTTAQGARKEPLVLIIGTQSPDDNSLMSQLVDYAKSVRSGEIEDPSFSGFVYEIPKEANVFDEKTWALANPALGDFRSLEEMQITAGRAKHMPTIEATFRNLFCNQRVDADDSWIPPALWAACKDEHINFDELAGQKCFAGLDLSDTKDLTSFSLFWPELGILNSWSWCPAENLKLQEDQDRVPYRLWAKQGFIEPTPGKAIDKARVAKRITEICKKFKPEEIGFDEWGFKELKYIMDAENLDLPPFRPFGQGYKSMSPATKGFEQKVLNRRLIHNGNPLLAWALKNVKIETDAAGNQKPNKGRSRERIDPIVASVMAVGLSIQPEKKKQYQVLFI